MKRNKKNREFVYFGKIEDFDRRKSIDYWQRQPAEVRMNAVWELVKDSYLLKGKSIDELRLQRSVALFKPV